MNKHYLICIVLIFQYTSILCQNTVQISFNESTPSQATAFDSTWNQEGINLSLDLGWLESVASTDQQGDYYIFGGTNKNSGKFKADFTEFVYKIDSVHFDVFDACGACFIVNMYDHTNGNFNMEFASVSDYGEDTLYYTNTFSTNPDSLVLETWEGGFRKLTVFYSSELTDVFDYNSTEDNFQFSENKLLFKNGFSDRFIELKVIDVSGRVVYQNMKFTGTHLDLGSLNSGIYLISANDKRNEQKHVSMKIRITH